MKYLLDTCVISDFVKGETNTLMRENLKEYLI
jgi:predicted nucleic acid-binding protein